MVKHGPRIYNLFPLLAGTTRQWIEHLDHVREMGFTAVYLNPVTRSGGSQSLYAVADYAQLDPRFDDGSGASSDEQLRNFLREAARRKLAVYMDLVINHTANDAALVQEHPEWYRRDETGRVEAPYAVDPSDPENMEKRTVWGDLAELDYRERPERAGMLAYFDQVVERAVMLGFSGFRCDAAYKLPGDAWKVLIDAARARNPQTVFLAETLGAPLEEIVQLKSAGFDAFFNSSKWWDFQSPWLLDQYEQLRHITPSIAFPESHDTPRFATEHNLNDAAAAERAYRLAYGFSAMFSTGVMITMGFEYGARKAVNVVHSSPQDTEAPFVDLSAYISAINAIKAAQPALNEEGPQRRIDIGTAAAIALERRTQNGEAPVITVINTSAQDVVIARSHIVSNTPHEVTPFAETSQDSDDSLHLAASSLRIFVAHA